MSDAATCDMCDEPKAVFRDDRCLDCHMIVEDRKQAIHDKIPRDKEGRYDAARDSRNHT